MNKCEKTQSLGKTRNVVRYPINMIKSVGKMGSVRPCWMQEGNGEKNMIPPGEQRTANLIACWREREAAEYPGQVLHI